ncbi:MAG: ABC transporter ATP-binding protein [Myxococcota bacterium]
MPPFRTVEARSVSKIYGRHRAVWRVDLTLNPSKVVGLLGPNGAGKTTLLWLFATLSRPSSGTRHFGDLPAQKATEARGHIGLLSHAALTYGELTAAENVAFFGRLYGADEPEKQARALLTEFGLEDALDRQAKTFSRGMQQRLGLARALIGRPSLVLLDEPFSGLDRASTEAVIERIKQLREAGAMILMISHDMAITAGLADEVAIMLRGRLAHRHEGSLEADALRELYSEVTETTRRGSK